MTKKMTLAALAAIAALSLGTAYAGGDKTDKSATGASATGAASGTAGASTDSMDSKKTWTKEEALKGGLTAEQFKAADVNGDGKLDAAELKAANIQTQSK